MKILKIPRSGVENFFRVLQLFGDVHAPVSVGDRSYAWQRVHSLSEVALDYVRTTLPFKKFFLPPEETLFRFSEPCTYEEVLDLPERKTVVFGAHSCDIHGMLRLDAIFGTDYPDKYYIARRNHMIVVGLSCMPDEYCFCASTDTAFSDEGFDLFLHQIRDGYLVRVGTTVGDDILDTAGEAVRTPDAADYEDFRNFERKRMESFQLEIEFGGLQENVDIAYDSKVWETYAEKCLGCGTCNITCPTCRCFDVRDMLDLDVTKGRRYRCWDSCLLHDHGLVAGGHNFRETIAERLRNRFYDKVFRNPSGEVNCVGCCRCTALCPADIPFVQILKEIRGEII